MLIIHWNCKILSFAWIYYFTLNIHLEYAVSYIIKYYYSIIFKYENNSKVILYIYIYNFICENILWRLLTTEQYGKYLMHLNIIKFKLSSKFKLLLIILNRC